MVAPSRACGLKHGVGAIVHLCRNVAPSRACGLKHEGKVYATTRIYRRALTGVWIETRDAGRVGRNVRVAPSRACGLKLFRAFRLR